MPSGGSKATAMGHTAGSHAVRDLDSTSTHDQPWPLRMIVRGFSRYAETVESLPFLERVKLIIVADFVLYSFLPGNFPITTIRLIGHADTDPERERREPGSVKRISEKRATLVQQFLQKEVALRGRTLRLAQVNPNPDMIRWVKSGVGSSEPDEANVLRKKTHANMTEADRKLNRRVQIFLEPGPWQYQNRQMRQERSGTPC